MYTDVPELIENPYTPDGLYYPQYRWLGILISVGAIITPICLVFVVSTDLLAISLLAYLNCTIMVTAIWRFLRKNTIAAMVPVISIPYFMAGSPMAILYFSVFYPQAHYSIAGGSVSHFDAGIRVQLCVLLFFIGYLLIISRALRNEQPSESTGTFHTHRFANLTIFLGLSLLLIHATSRVVRLQEFLIYLTNAAYKYLNGLFFAAGVLIKDTSKVVKIVLFASIAIAVFFYTVGNARGIVLLPVAIFVFGIISLSRLSQKTKLTIVICFIFAFPSYILIADTTRVLLKTGGYGEGFSYRLQQLKDWKYVTREKSAKAAAFGRLFHTGGHSIIARTPTQVPYRRFSLIAYANEMLGSLLLGRIYLQTYYRGAIILLDYGFTIVPGSTAVEISMLGSFWLLGGYLFVFTGGIALGLVHALVVAILRRAYVRSKVKALTYFSILAPSLLWASNVGFISHWRDLMYRLVIGFILYQVLRWVAGEQHYDHYSFDEYAIAQDQLEAY